MSIQGVDRSAGHRVDPAAFRKPSFAKNPKSDTQTQQSATAPQNIEPVPTSDTDHAKGVLRLLEEGHFKGVADVRLRINFFDELYAGAAATSNQNTQQSADDLVNTVNAQLDELIGSLELDEPTSLAVGDLRTAFETQVDDALAVYLQSESPDQNVLTEAIHASFDSFVDQLRTLLYPPSPPEEPVADTPTDETAAPTDPVEPPSEPTDPSTETTAPTETPTDPTVIVAEEPAADTTVPDSTAPTDPAVVAAEEPPVETAEPEDPLAALIAAFEESLAHLLDSTDVNALLPDPSPPSGNGVAYDKFLAIYNELRGIAPAETSEPVTLDETG